MFLSSPDDICFLKARGLKDGVRPEKYAQDKIVLQKCIIYNVACKTRKLQRISTFYLSSCIQIITYQAPHDRDVELRLSVSASRWAALLVLSPALWVI